MSQRKPRSPCKTSKGIKKTKLRQSARIANSSQETIDNEPSVISDETKSASEIEKTLPDIIPPRRITRSTKESQCDNKDDNETNPSTDKSELTEVSSGKKIMRKAEVSGDSAMKSDPTHHTSPASVLRKISRIVTRSHTKEDDLDKKEQINVPKNTELDNKPTARITRSHKVASTGNLSQPSLTENEAQRMRTRSQSSDKSENSLKSSKNMDTSRDSTLDVTVSLLNMKIDPQTKYMVSTMGRKEDEKGEYITTPKITPIKRHHSNDESNGNMSKKKKRKKNQSEDKKKENYSQNDTYDDNLDDLQPVNSEMDIIGPTSENSPATPTPRHNRRRTRSATSNNGDASRKKSTQKKQREEEIPKGKEDDYAEGVTSENSAATPTPTRMRTRSSKSTDVDPTSQKSQQDGESTKGHEDDYAKDVTSENSASAPTPTRMRTRSRKSTDGDPNRQSSSQKKQPDTQNTKGNEDDDDVFQCQICNKTFTDFVQIKQHKIVCTRIKKKYVCPKCNKGFDQKAHFQQHFDYRHTSKKPQFVCKPCQKTFELKKVWQEHNRCLHNTDDYKYLCDTCSRGFFHLGEFKAHRAKHTNIKPFTCGICKNASFAVISRLQKHLETCGKEGNVECKTCGKLLSDVKSLNTHIAKVHNDTIYTCEICEDRTYTSQGGYYRHMRSMHNIGRNGQKL